MQSKTSLNKKALRAEFRHTQKNLKTMSKAGRAHQLRTNTRVIKYGAISFSRNIWLSLASILIMTVTLLIMFVSILAAQILTATANDMSQKIDITIYFDPATTSEVLNQLKATIEANSNVKTVTVRTAEEEYNLMLDEYADEPDLIATLEDLRDQTIASTPATMSIKVYDAQKIDGIKSLIESDRTFLAYLSTDETKQPTYNSNKTEIDTINSWSNIAKYGGVILSVIFFFVSILVIFNTIRMAIFSRREEIYMMRLVGADNTFIKGPFLIEAQISGLISGLLAATLSFLCFCAIADGLTDYGISVNVVSDLFTTNLLVVVYAGFVLTGLLITTLSANFAIHKYLRQKTT